jgi:hypothetical protein
MDSTSTLSEGKGIRLAERLGLNVIRTVGRDILAPVFPAGRAAPDISTSTRACSSVSHVKRRCPRSTRQRFALAGEMGLRFDRAVENSAQSQWRRRNTRVGAGRAGIDVPNAGPYTLNLWQREVDPRIDRIPLTRDAALPAIGFSSSSDGAA